MSDHRYKRVTGVTSPLEDVVIECTCGNVSRGRTFAKANDAHERHRTEAALKEVARG